jgi:opacity protein-like surface antigen
MKSILAVAALLASLSVPALAEEAATPPPPVQQSTAPSTEEIVPAAAPQSQAEGESDMMTLPAEPSVAKGSGGCAHGKTVYLTN